VAVETISTVLVAATATPPAGAYDLTDLATVHDEIGEPANDPSNDPFLSRAITQASVAIANYCNRVFAIEALQDQLFIQQDPYPYQVPGGVYPLQLSRWPMTNTAAGSFTGNTHGTTTIDGIASTTGLTAGLLVFGAGIPAATKIQSVASNSVVLTAAATASANGVAFTTGVQIVQTLSVGDMQTLVCGTDFTIDAVRGWLIRLNAWTGISVPWEAEPVTVQYQAGYATAPPDLVNACLRLVTSRFRARGRDPMLIEETQGQIGTQRYWVGNTPGQQGAFAPEIEALISQYRVPVIS
jgi:hypothetical protein